MTMTLTNRQQAYITAILTHAPALGIDTNKISFSRAELRQISMTEKGKIWIPNWITHDQSRRAGRGVFNIPEVQDQMVNTPTTPDSTIREEVESRMTKDEASCEPAIIM